MTSRTHCTQAVFGGCPGEGCERDCFTARLATINAKIAAERAREVRLYARLALAALIPLFILAASVGLTRAERAYQQEQV